MRTMKIALSRTLPLLLSATAATISANPYSTLISRSTREAFINSLSTSLSSKTTKHNLRMTSLSSSSSSSFSWSPQQKQTLLSCPTIPLRDGTPHPAIGFGTYKVGFVPASASSAATAAASGSGNNEPQRTAEECVRDALDLGYRFFEWLVLHSIISKAVRMTIAHSFIWYRLFL